MNLRLRGIYKKKLGGGCKHALSPNLHQNTLKKQKKLHWVGEGGGSRHSTVGSLIPRGGVYKYHWVPCIYNDQLVYNNNVIALKYKSLVRCIFFSLWFKIVRCLFLSVLFTTQHEGLCNGEWDHVRGSYIKL